MMKQDLLKDDTVFFTGVSIVPSRFDQVVDHIPF